MSVIAKQNGHRVADLNNLVVSINEEHSKAAECMWAGVQHAIRAGELLIEAKSQVEHGQWLPWLEANCEFSERTAQGYMRLAKELPKLDAEKRNRVADLTFRDALKSIAGTAKVLRSFSEPQAEAMFENAENKNSVYRATIQVCRDANRERDREQEPLRSESCGEDRPIDLIREKHSREDGRHIWSIRMGPNAAGLALRSNLDALKLEPTFADRRREIDCQIERVKALRREADRIEAEARENGRNLADDLLIEVTLRHGWPNPVSHILSYWLTEDFDHELAALDEDSAFDIFLEAIRDKDTRITAKSQGWNGDICWMSYIWISDKVRATLAKAGA